MAKKKIKVVVNPPKVRLPKILMNTKTNFKKTVPLFARYETAVRWTVFVVIALLMGWAGFSMQVAFIRWVCN